MSLCPRWAPPGRDTASWEFLAAQWSGPRAFMVGVQPPARELRSRKEGEVARKKTKKEKQHPVMPSQRESQVGAQTQGAPDPASGTCGSQEA